MSTANTLVQATIIFCLDCSNGLSTVSPFAPYSLFSAGRQNHLLKIYIGSCHSPDHNSPGTSHDTYNTILFPDHSLTWSSLPDHSPSGLCLSSHKGPSWYSLNTASSSPLPRGPLYVPVPLPAPDRPPSLCLFRFLLKCHLLGEASSAPCI